MLIKWIKRHPTGAALYVMMMAFILAAGVAASGIWLLTAKIESDQQLLRIMEERLLQAQLPIPDKLPPAPKENTVLGYMGWTAAAALLGVALGLVLGRRRQSDRRVAPVAEPMAKPARALDQPHPEIGPLSTIPDVRREVSEPLHPVPPNAQEPPQVPVPSPSEPAPATVSAAESATEAKPYGPPPTIAQ
jgi:hypothetical protein